MAHHDQLTGTLGRNLQNSVSRVSLENHLLHGETGFVLDPGKQGQGLGRQLGFALGTMYTELKYLMIGDDTQSQETRRQSFGYHRTQFGGVEALLGAVHATENSSPVEHDLTPHVCAQFHRQNKTYILALVARGSQALLFLIRPSVAGGPDQC